MGLSCWFPICLRLGCGWVFIKRILVIWQLSTRFYQGIGLAAFVYTLAMLLLLALLGSYNSLRIRKIHKEFFIVLEANAIGVLLAEALLFTLHLQDFSRGVLAVFFIISTGLLFTKRLGLRYVLFWMRRNGYNQKRVLVVGCGRLARQYITNISTYRDLGFTAAGYFGKPDTNAGIPYLGGYREIEAFFEAYRSGCDDTGFGTGRD